MLLTACRVNEIVSAKWNDIDFDNQLWTIPKENVKAKKGSEKVHHIPLNEYICSLLTEVKGSNGYLKSAYLFPSLTCTSVAPGKKTIDKRSVARAVNRNIEKLGVEPFTPHDLRRTASTLLGKLGVNPIVIEKVLNHELVGMMLIYNQYNYLEEREAALKLLGEKLAPKIGLDSEHPQ